MQLEITSGPEAGRVVRITGPRLTVGRDPECDVVIKDEEVSRKHAYLEPLPDGRVALRDLDSRNGTYVDGDRVDAVLLKGGEQIKVGETMLFASLDATVIGTVPKPEAGPVAPEALTDPAPAPPAESPPPVAPQATAQPPPPPPTAPPAPPPVGPPQTPRTAPPPKPPSPREGDRRGSSVIGPIRDRGQSAIQRMALMRQVHRATVVGVVVGVLVVALAVLFGTGVLPPGDDGSGTRDAADVVQQVTPSTVLVVTDLGGGDGGRGTGVVLDAGKGTIVTNAHVTNGGRSYTIGAGSKIPLAADRMSIRVGRRARSARLLGEALCEDLAVLRVRDTRGLQSIRLIGSQSSLRIGQSVIAVGYPVNAAGDFTADLTGTTGVVSVPRTTTPAVGIQGGRTGPYRNVVQTDAAINSGNSGGPLVDLRGDLVGVNATTRARVQGQGFAIGVDRVRQIVPRLERGQDVCA